MRLSGVLYDAGGPLASVQIKFEAAKTTLNGVIVSAEHIFTTQQDGTYFIELEPGYYTVSWLERGRPVRLGTIVADTDSQMSLPEALEADYTPMQPSYIQGALDQMRADLEAAQEAASTAAADVSDMLTQMVAESADRAEREADRAQVEADRANTYADNAGYVTRERLRKQATLDLDFASGDYALDDGEKLRTTNAGEVLTVERATPKWVFGPNGKLREVPPNTLARQWNPETGEPEGVLIEESRTNLLLWSEDFTQEVWDSSTAPIAPSSVPAPDGSGTFFKLTPKGGESFRVFQQHSAGLAENEVVTIGCFFKPAEWDSLRIGLRTRDGGSRLAVFNATTKTMDVGSAVSADFVELGNGEYYVWAACETGVGPSTVIVRYYPINDGDVGTVGDGTSGIYIWGAQLEAASTPSSYIPTEDAQVTRAADDVYRTLGEEFNPQAGTVFVDARNVVANSTEDFAFVFRLDDGTGDNKIEVIRRRNGQCRLELVSYGVRQHDYTNLYLGTDSPKIAVSWKNGGDVHWVVDGVVIVSGQQISAPVGVTTLNIGRAPALSQTIGRAVFKDVRYIPRALSEQELIELTS